MFPSALLSVLHGIFITLRAEVIDLYYSWHFPVYSHISTQKNKKNKTYLGLSPYYFEHKHVALCSFLESCFDKLSPVRQRN